MLPVCKSDTKQKLFEMCYKMLQTAFYIITKLKFNFLNRKINFWIMLYGKGKVF
jgi:hypothetical protein